VGGRDEVGQPRRPAVEDGAVTRAQEQLEVAVEEAHLQLGLGVAAHDEREAVGLGRRIGGARHQLVGLQPEHTRQERDRSLPGGAQVALEVGQGHPGHRDAIGQLLLGPAQLRPELGDALSE
jgi:hypothetical protein